MADYLGSKPDYVKYAVWQEEKVGQNRYLQFMVSTRYSIRKTTLLNKFPARCSVEWAYRPCSAVEYCKKESSRVEGGLSGEWGIEPYDPTMARKGKHHMHDAPKSRASEKIAAANMLVNGASYQEIRNAYPDTCISYWHQIKADAKRIKLEWRRKRKLKETKGVVLRPWQQVLNHILSEESDSRHIWVVYDPTGNTGKSWFAGYYKDTNINKSVHILENSKKENLKYVLNEIDNPDIIFMDLVRTDTKCVAMGVLESIKDTHFASGKYESQVVEWDHPPHLVIFTNNILNWADMSIDRWRIMVLTDPNHCLVMPPFSPGDEIKMEALKDDTFKKRVWTSFPPRDKYGGQYPMLQHKDPCESESEDAEVEREVEIPTKKTFEFSFTGF